LLQKANSGSSWRLSSEQFGGTEKAPKFGVPEEAFGFSDWTSWTGTEEKFRQFFGSLKFAECQ